MRLIVSGLETAPVKFVHLWGRYILGFKPWTHCLKCFETKRAANVVPGMLDGEYALNDEQKLFYLCGVGQPDRKRGDRAVHRRFTNVHLAVRPRIGSTASVGSLYGATFTITDAQAIPIVALSQEQMPGLKSEHFACKNFQFGYQMFSATAVGEASLERGVVRELRLNPQAGSSHSLPR